MTDALDLKGRRLLVVEDEYIIAADLAASLEALGGRAALLARKLRATNRRNSSSCPGMVKISAVLRSSPENSRLLIGEPGS